MSENEVKGFEFSAKTRDPRYSFMYDLAQSLGGRVEHLRKYVSSDFTIEGSVTPISGAYEVETRIVPADELGFSAYCAASFLSDVVENSSRALGVSLQDRFLLARKVLADNGANLADVYAIRKEFISKDTLKNIIVKTDSVLVYASGAEPKKYSELFQSYLLAEGIITLDRDKVVEIRREARRKLFLGQNVREVLQHKESLPAILRVPLSASDEEILKCLSPGEFPFSSSISVDFLQLLLSSK